MPQARSRFERLPKRSCLATSRPGIRTAGGEREARAVARADNQPGGDHLPRLFAVALRALRFQPGLFFFDGSADFENFVTLLTVIIVERHRVTPFFSLLYSSPPLS